MKTQRIIKDKIRGVESILLENNFQYFNIKKKFTEPVPGNLLHPRDL